MQLLDDGAIIFSASDLSVAAKCEWAVMRRLDHKLGRLHTAPPKDESAMLDRTAVLGNAHELAVLATLETEFGAAVTVVRPTSRGDADSWRASMKKVTDQTLDALKTGAPLIFQAAFFDCSFQGFADFIVRSGTATDGRPEYEVFDTKLARHAKITALLQLAAYVDQLTKNGIPTGPEVHLILGTGEKSSHRVSDIMPVYLQQRDRLQKNIAERLAATTATPWRDPALKACGSCATCSEQVKLHDDVLLVAGMRLTQRAVLAKAGILSIQQLAESTAAVPGMGQKTLDTLRGQARAQMHTQTQTHTNEHTNDNTNQHPAPYWEIRDADALRALPLPDAGDLFFDFEGDPLYQEGKAWNLDYLFGMVDDQSTFTALWAHDLAGERQAFVDFLATVRRLRAAHPTMHIYHYAAYEKTHLLQLAVRHGFGEDEVDDLLRENVLVDLYPIVRQALRIGSPSYSLKKLEPLYMGDAEREGVANAADSVAMYAQYCDERDAGLTQAAAKTLADIEQYNAYDCRSTLELRNWLIARAAENNIALASARDLELDVRTIDVDPVHGKLQALLADVALENRTPHDTAIALAAAAIDFHRREDKSFWWGHFARLSDPLEDWAETRDVFVVESVTVERDWYREGRQQNDRRILRIETTPAPGSKMTADAKPFVVYDRPYPPIAHSDDPGRRPAHHRVLVLEVLSDTTFLVQESLGANDEQHDCVPLALTPQNPPDTTSIRAAISSWANRIMDAPGHDLQDPSFDIVSKRAPRLDFLVRPSAPTLTHEAIRDSLLKLDRSYIAVQGPPGSGKTFTGSRVIADLVNVHGWKVGVVAQGHATVENLLEGIVKAGVSPNLVAKKAKANTGSHPVTRSWTVISDKKYAEFLSQPGGRVIGGTAWDFTNLERVARGSLDLLVIDEAGQFSLANTIAVSTAAQRLLLLGDPQQLPQVSQGDHPEEVDRSALGWLSDGTNVLPENLGYFLAESWRMSPGVCGPISALSYDGKLESAAPKDRALEDLDSGIYARAISHQQANSTESPEEATAVVDTVTKLLNNGPRDWTEKGTTRPLKQSDIIVVAPYNAQVQLIRASLDGAGFTSVPVGTVDKFQGQEAVISIISMTASSADDVPRGMEFLLLTNRINVAVSRAKWASIVIYSDRLTEYLPTSVDQVTLLSRFLNLVTGAREFS
ncbi:MAG: TM0106 family RecB-like putative nuclease [Actinomycetales bacterium]|nr:TM0106 family RecB-like putative nuclease [Actinomycetales bacterium]